MATVQCISDETSKAVGNSAEMAGVFSDYAKLSRLLFVFHHIGNVFLALLNLSDVVKRFVYRETTGDPSVYSGDDDTAIFVAQSQSLVQLYPAVQEPADKLFREFHDFSISCGQPLASLLISTRTSCRKCGKALKVEQKRVHVVVIYHSERGTYLGSRVTKNCRNCKVYEHYGFWTDDGVKHIDAGCLDKEFILSSEDTAFHLSLIRQCASLLNVGAVPFSAFASSYNRRFNYSKESSSEVNGSARGKRMKR